MLWLYRRVMFGEVTNPEVRHMSDLATREWLIFIPLVAAVLWLGIHPTSMTSSISPTVKHLLTQTTPQPVVAASDPVPKDPADAKKETAKPPIEKTDDEALPPAELPSPDAVKKLTKNTEQDH
jgi:hypothetical protein